MLIRAYSDFHGFLPYVEPCDLLLIAGDISPIGGEYGDHTAETQSRWLTDVFKPWCEGMPVPNIVLIGGNHDAILDPMHSGGFQPELHEKVTYLLDASVQVESGPRIFGQPWIPNLKRWPFYKDNTELEKLATLLPRDADFWMLHGPPMRPPRDRRPYVLDRVKLEHVGNRWATDRIIEVQPQLVICGHIHEGFEMGEIGETPIANVAFVDRQYVPCFRHLDIVWDEARREIDETRLIEDDEARGLWWNCAPTR